MYTIIFMGRIKLPVILLGARDLQGNSKLTENDYVEELHSKLRILPTK